eukprot:316284_1
MLAFWFLLSALSSIAAYNQQDIKNWDKSDIEKWLKGVKMSADGIQYILDSGISDGEDLLWLRNQKKTRSELSSGLRRASDRASFKEGLSELLVEELELEYVIGSLKEECELPKTRMQNAAVCKCINTKTIQKQRQEDEDTESEEEEDDDKLNVYYTVNDLIKTNDELRTEISFKVLNEEISGIFYLKWCAVENSNTFCSKQSFSFRKHKEHKMATTILTGIAYDFEIYDVNDKYHWRLRDFTDSKPNQAFYFSGIMIHSTLDKNTLGDEKLRTANGANFDMLIEVQLSHQFGIGVSQQRIDCDSNDNNDDPSQIQLICVLNIVPNSVDENDKLMAEKIRSVLLDKYRANNADVSQKMDANSFNSGIDIHSNWAFSSNSTLFIICAVVLCGGIMVGIQKKFPFKYHTAAVYTKLTHHIMKDKSNTNEETNHNFESISIQKQSNVNKTQNEFELNVNTANTPKNSAQEFLENVFKNLGTPSFITSKYIQNLKDDYISSIDQLREFDDGDWKRYGFKKNHIMEIKNKLQSYDDEDDELTFDEDEDDDDETQNINQSENNDSTT